jgi:hypothetical protein
MDNMRRIADQYPVCQESLPIIKQATRANDKWTLEFVLFVPALPRCTFGASDRLCPNGPQTLRLKPVGPESERVARQATFYIKRRC